MLAADLRVDITVDLSTSRQSRLFTRKMQSLTLKQTINTAPWLCCNIHLQFSIHDTPLGDGSDVHWAVAGEHRVVPSAGQVQAKIFVVTDLSHVDIDSLCFPILKKNIIQTKGSSGLPYFSTLLIKKSVQKLCWSHQ